MMKNKMMRAASILLVAVLLSTCAISGTFAKYVTTNEASDSARVAKFGVVIQADGSLYGQYYQADTNNKPTATADGVTVSAAADAVAPGTESDKGLNFSINGTPEVSTQLDVTIAVQNIFLREGTYAVMVKAPNVTAESFKNNTYYTKDAETKVYSKAANYVSGTVYYTMEDKVELTVVNDSNVDYYFPVVYNSTLSTGHSHTADSLNAIAAAYAARFKGEAVTATTTDCVSTYTVSKQYAPNYNYTDTLGVANDTLTWAWAIETGSDVPEKEMYNGADTILAQLQAGALADAEVVRVDAAIKAPVEHTDYNLETSFNITITVTQVD